MSFFEEAEREVRSFRKGEIHVRNYRLSLTEIAQSGLGIESNRQGSPYAPLSASDLTGGAFLIEWSDGRLSRGAVSRTALAGLREVIESAFEGRHEDPDAAVFSPEAESPDVEVYSADTADIAEGRSPAFLPDALAAVREVADAHDVKLLDASVQATRTVLRVASSGGFRGRSESTLVSFSAGYDALAWDGHGFRDPPSLAEVRERAERTAEDLESLRTVSEERLNGAGTVVLHPRVAESFLRAFLLGNLAGSAVATGRSRFTADDFRVGAAWFREDFGLRAHPLREMATGSYQFTEEGLPARDVEFVRDGALVTPSLGLKYARRLGLQPAPLPAAFDGLELSLGEPLGREAALAAEETVLLVHGVLGLHTQDPVRAEYSVLAPHSVLFRKGRPAGRVSATLNGSFFADLKSPELSLVTFPGFTTPGLKLRLGLS